MRLSCVGFALVTRPEYEEQRKGPPVRSQGPEGSKTPSMVKDKACTKKACIFFYHIVPWFFSFCFATIQFLMGSIVGLQPAWLLIALPIGARVGALYGVGDLLGLLLAVPVASCIKTLADAARAGELTPPESPHAPGAL